MTLQCNICSVCSHTWNLLLYNSESDTYWRTGKCCITYLLILATWINYIMYERTWFSLKWNRHYSKLNGRSQFGSVAEGWFYTLCCWEAARPYPWLIMEENERLEADAEKLKTLLWKPCDSTWSLVRSPPLSRTVRAVPSYNCTLRLAWIWCFHSFRKFYS